MPEAFLTLPREEQAQILQTLATKLGRRATVLEKDVWICLTLKNLFSMPDCAPMVFKGGTSLSKVFQAIKRFSEDVDITIDHRALDPTVDPYEDGLSRNKKNVLSKRLRELAREYVKNAILPYLQTAMRETLQPEVPMEVLKEGDELRIIYPSALDRGQGEYLGEGVLLEFGGRSRIEPNLETIIRPDIAAELENLDFPEASVTVLSPKRTFWEKATLIHELSSRGKWENRSSRHWCDLAVLADHKIGRDALADRVLLKDVVKTKETMFVQPKAKYMDCLKGGFTLVPGGEMLAKLKVDFNTMKGSGMFYEEPPSFEEIIQRLGKLEQQINKGSEPA